MLLLLVTIKLDLKGSPLIDTGFGLASIENFMREAKKGGTILFEYLFFHEPTELSL